MALFVQVSRCWLAFDGPVTALAAIWFVVVSGGVSLVVISRRGSSLPGRGVGRKACGPALRPVPRAGSRSACRAEVTTVPT
jgi:hypothetical protein